MAKAGRPPLSGEARKGRLLVCLEPWLRTEIEGLAEESRRSLSDYCRYVLEQHVLAVREEEDETTEELTVDEAIEKNETVEIEDPEIPRCGDCHKSFQDCEC